MRIKKISPTTPANGNIENQYGTSQTNAYSEAYVNSKLAEKLDTTGTAYNSSRIGGWEMDSPTVNDTDTWIPVFGASKIQHTTISSLVSRGDSATQSVKGLMSGSDKTKLDNMKIYSAHYAFGQTTEAYINVTGTFTLLFVYGLNGGSANFFGTNFHTDNAEVSQITGSAPTFSFVNSRKIKIKTSSAWGQIVVISNNLVTITAS